VAVVGVDMAVVEAADAVVIAAGAAAEVVAVAVTEVIVAVAGIAATAGNFLAPLLCFCFSVRDGLCPGFSLQFPRSAVSGSSADFRSGLPRVYAQAKIILLAMCFFWL
jgi:hypothetical protein